MRRRREEVVVRAAHTTRKSRMVWWVEAGWVEGAGWLPAPGAPCCEGWAGVQGGDGAGEGRSEVDVPLDLATTFTG